MIHSGKYFACPLTSAMHRIGGKWKVVIIGHLFTGTKRFGELKRLLEGVSQKMLTQQLKELENDGLIHREVYAEVPPKVEYSLTEFGKTLGPILELLCEWGEKANQQVLKNNQTKVV